MTQDRINTLEELGFVWSKKNENNNTAIKKNHNESHVASDNSSCAIAVSNAEPAASTANVAAVDLTKNAQVEGISGDEEEIFAYILRCVTSKTIPVNH